MLEVLSAAAGTIISRLPTPIAAASGIGEGAEKGVAAKPVHVSWCGSMHVAIHPEHLSGLLQEVFTDMELLEEADVSIEVGDGFGSGVVGLGGV